MADRESLINREFIGVVLSNRDNSHRGQYMVNIPELQPHMKSYHGIWCKNHVNKYRVTPSRIGVVGSYYPLQSGMAVIVKFFANDINSGYVDRIISDPYANTLPLEVIERDDYYQIIRTPRYNNIIAIYEGPPPIDDEGVEEQWTPENSQSSKNVPRNSIHIYFNETRTTVVIDETGLNVKTEDNINITVHEHDGTPGNIKLTVQGTADIKVTGDAKIESSANVHVKAGSNAYVDGGSDVHVNAGGTAYVTGNGGDVHVKANGSVNVQGATVNLNGTATPATPASSAALADDPTLLTFEDFEYFKRSTGK